MLTVEDEGTRPVRQHPGIELGTINADEAEMETAMLAGDEGSSILAWPASQKQSFQSAPELVRCVGRTLHQASISMS